MKETEVRVPGEDVNVVSEPELLRRREVITQSIDLDALFTKDVTTSGSFDLSHVRNVSFGRLLEAIPIPTLLVDPSSSIVFTNRAVGKLAGDTPQLVGKAFSSLFAVPAESRRAESGLQSVFSNRRTRIIEGLVRIDSNFLWCRIHLRSIRFRNQRSVLAIVEDLTSEKKQLLINEKYHQLVDIFPIGIAEFTLKPPVAVDRPATDVLASVYESELSSGNCEFARIHGYSEIDLMRGIRLDRVFPSGDTYRHFYYTWINSSFPARGFETEEKGREGAVRYFENTLVGSVRNGYLLGLWAMKQDITGRKESEQALRAARDKLEERVRERTAELLATNQKLVMEIRDRRRAEEELEKLVGQLQEALAKVKTLSGLLPICASCKKIRDDKGYWTQVEVYVREHTDAEFTHGICPECAARLYPEYYDPKFFKADR